MRFRFAPGAVLLCTLVPFTADPAPAQSVFPPDSVIQALIDARVGEGVTPGIALGLIEPDGSTRFFAAGAAGPGRTLNAQSVFEIGSITKAFTGILLADMVLRGEVSLDDPVSKYLPSTVTMPSREGRQITLAHLSMQNSGLPRLPGNMHPADPLNPYADYSVDQLYEFLSGYSLTRDPGAQYEYSNLAVGLLGHVLSLRAGKSYEALVKERILEPLGMANTAITLTPWMTAHVVAGHNASGDTVPLWDLPTLASAGALRSNVEDMTKLIEAALRGSGPVHDAIRMASERHADVAGPTTIGLGWHRTATATDTVVWHNGGTGGFRTYAGFVPAARKGVVLLTNGSGQGADDIAFHLLDSSLPLAPPARRAIDLPESAMARYVGTYEMAPGATFDVTLADGVLRGQPAGQNALRLWPESETEFFLREIDAQITFDVGADGVVTGLVLHQNGRDLPARKVR